jgi:DNA-binding CsgD family transcriptional regulator/tetratricopeptide (TPR) repeat protein
VRTERDGSGPARLLGTPDFVGRGGELATLRAVLATPHTVVLVEGEAGIGKSRLVREYLASAESCVLVAGCPPFRQPQTLGPVADAVRQVAGEVSGLGLSGLAGALRPLFPEWAADLPPAPEPAEDATAARYRLFAALAEVIDSLGVSLLVLEDAHWADEATVEFLLFLASRPGTPGAPGSGRPVSLLVTLRPEDAPAGSLLPRLARLSTGSSGVRIALSALNVADTARMVSSMLTGEQMSVEFAGFMHTHTGGVPLAVEESVRLMATRADLSRRGGQWVRRELAELSVPPPVRDAVLERAGRLAPDSQAVLRAAAVLGEPAADTILGAVTGFSAERLRAGLSDVLACGLLADDSRGMASFRHVLAARAVYESIPAPDRRLLHQLAGQALEGLSPPPVAALARHFREAGDTANWLRYGEQAAALARAAGDESTAAVLRHDLVTGAGLPGPAMARVANGIVLLALTAEDQLAGLAAALRGAIDAGGITPAEEAALRFQLGRTLSTMQEYDASRAELERAVTGLPPDSLQAVRVMMLLGWPQGSTCPAAEHSRWLVRAAAADATVPPAERLRLLVDRASALLMLGEEAGWAEAARIPWEAATPSDRLQVIRAQGNLGESALVWGRYAEARRRLEHATALADRHGNARFRGIGLITLAHLDWLTGTWGGLAERAATLAADSDLQPVYRLESALVTGLLRVAAGDREPALQALGQVADDAARRGAVDNVMEPAAALARLHLADDNVAQALKVTADPLEIVARKGIWLWAADLVPARVAALAAAGRLAEAATLTGAFAAGLRGRDIPAASAGLVLARAILAEANGQLTDAAGLFGQAAAAWLALPRPYDALLASERKARCLLAAGPDETGLRILARTADGLRALGAHGDHGRVAAALREHGEGSPAPRGRGRPSYGDELSPRELEVVRLVAQGRTNRQIADTLVLSRQTVESHVHSAMRKLRVSSRTALAVTATERGILPSAAAENIHPTAAVDLSP